MAEDRLTILYEWSEAMTNAGDSVKDKHEEDYKKIMNYVKTSENTKERIMAAQLVARFFKFFPELEDEAFDSIVDLCESADVDVRKHATMAMITICRGSKQVVSKAADILIQLYQTNQPSEVNLINQSLATLLNLNIEQFLKSFFANFEDGSELVRERALKFLTSRIHTVAEAQLTKEVEESLMNYTKKAMEDVSKDEFISFIGILSKLKIAKTSSGQATLVAAIRSQAELSKDFNADDKESLDKLLLCTKHTIPFLSQYNRASEYINYICLKVLPHLSELATTGQDLNILQILAEMSPHVIVDDDQNMINLDECHRAVHAKLVEYLPLPSESIETSEQRQPQQTSENTLIETTTESKTADTNDGQGEQVEANTETGPEQKADEQAIETTKDDPEEPPTQKVAAAGKAPSTQETDFQFTHIEYLLYTFVQLSRLKPELYSESIQVESRKHLQNLSNGCKKYTGALEKQLTNVKRNDLNKEENKLRSIALRTTKNISTMILGLFKKPAEFKTSITLSCKPVRLDSAPTVGASITNNNSSNNNSNNKSQMKMKHGGVYRPPQRSNNSGGFNNRQSGVGDNRQAGQKSKYRGNYQSDNRNKRPRHSR